MSEPKWTFGKFITKMGPSAPTAPFEVGGTSYVDTSTGDWTIGSFVYPPCSGEIAIVRNQLPLPPLEADEDTPEQDAGPQR
jgi:hypothetical protein